MIMDAKVCVMIDDCRFELRRLLVAEAKFLVPDWGKIVDYGIRLSYRPARLHRLAGRYDICMP